MPLYENPPPTSAADRRIALYPLPLGEHWQCWVAVMTESGDACSLKSWKRQKTFALVEVYIFPIRVVLFPI